ncbi:UNVERIFIED_CONTAM: AhpD family alkylhydroperoxidase [Williamsia faeni]
MRIPPLPADEWNENVEAAFKGMLPRERMNPEGAGNALATLARHPDLAKAFVGFNLYITFRSTLPPRVRELAVLRVAALTDCAYETSGHLPMAKDAGLSDREVTAAQGGIAADQFEQSVLDAVVELTKNTQLSEVTWKSLSEQLDEQQRMDLVFTIGSYYLVAMAFNTFGVQPDA